MTEVTGKFGSLLDSETTVRMEEATNAMLNYNECLKKNGVSGDDLKEAQKDFFESYTSRYCANYSAEDIQKHLADVHGFNQIRVNGIVQHMEGWYDLYNVKEEDMLYLPKEERINIW